MFSREITGASGKTLLVQSENGQVTLAVLGPRGGVIGSVTLNDRQAGLAATAVMHAYQNRGQGQS